MDKKPCKDCKKEKEITEFFRQKKGYRNICKKCDVKRRGILYTKHRVLVLKHYSKGEMKCALCPENRVEALDVDHINGGGTEERNKLKNSTAIYLKIIRDNFPDKYRILCRNCNWIEYLKRLRIKKLNQA